MKTMILVPMLLAMVMSSALSQEPKGGRALMESHSSSRREKGEKRAPAKASKPTAEILGKRVILGGYFTDFFKAERKRPLFSLREPIDPQRDLENLWYYPGTDRIQGVVLFSVQF